MLDAAACGSLDAVLAKHGLILRWTMSLIPEHYLAQALRPSVAAIYVYPSSAPLHAAHRRVGSRTQSRLMIPPGGCLLRGEASRREWTLAMPPLLLPQAVESTAAPDAAAPAAVAAATAARQLQGGGRDGEDDQVRLSLGSERTSSRKFAVLVDAGVIDLDADEEGFECEVYRPRAVL